MKMVLILCLILYSCTDSQHSVSIYNNSGKPIDSATVEINNYKMKFGQINPNASAKQVVSRKLIKAGHDVIYNVHFFLKDTSIKQFIFSNDLGFVPPVFNVHLTDSLRVHYNYDGSF